MHSEDEALDFSDKTEDTNKTLSQKLNSKQNRLDVNSRY
jgi:hypothetical protein